MIALKPFLRPVAIAAAGLALLIGWTVWHRQDAVADYKAALALQIERQRAEDRATAERTRRDVESLDDRELRDALSGGMRPPG